MTPQQNHSLIRKQYYLFLKCKLKAQTITCNLLCDNSSFALRQQSSFLDCKSLRKILFQNFINLKIMTHNAKKLQPCKETVSRCVCFRKISFIKCYKNIYKSKAFNLLEEVPMQTHHPRHLYHKRNYTLPVCNFTHQRKGRFKTKSKTNHPCKRAQ